MLLEHAAEIIAVGKAAVLRNLFDGLFRMTEEMAGAVEAVAEEDTHGGEADLRAEEVIEVAHADPGGPGGVVGIDPAPEVGMKKLHRLVDATVQFLVGPRLGRQFREGVDDEGG